MNDWLSAIHTLTATATPAVLVTVASVEGSGPREPGAKMVVTQQGQFDTIGGGHLEMRATDIAREMLRNDAQRRIERFPLGPSLGQCCGGVVHLAFERVDPSSRDYYRRLGEQWRERQDCWRLVALDDAQAPVLVDSTGESLYGGAPSAFLHFEPLPACHVVRDEKGRQWLVDPCLAYRPHLLLFGAGHVGAAIVRALAELPCHVTWVDEREDMFPPSVPANTRIEATDVPEAVIAEAGPGASYLVMTHSHALDQHLCEEILRRDDAGWFGLIGSKTKRMQFEHRLRERGITREQLDEMVCPIGVPGITGKQPAVIAAAVAAQLLQVWEEQERTGEQAQGARHVSISG